MRYYFLFFLVFTLTKGFAQGESKFQHIHEACELSKKISNENVRTTVLSKLEACKNCFIQENNDTSTHLLSLYENLDEIMCDCDQDELKAEISSCIGEVFGQFR